MMKPEVQKEFNLQIQEELYSSYLYLAMSSWFKAQNLEGFAGWLQVQAQEEMAHAMKFYGFLHNRNAEVELLALNAPPKSWKKPVEAFQAAYDHERHISGRIDKLVELSRQHQDHAGEVFLQWFVTEQVEEEQAALLVVEKLKMIADHPGGLYLLDKEMGGRAGSGN